MSISIWVVVVVGVDMLWMMYSLVDGMDVDVVVVDDDVDGIGIQRIQQTRKIPIWLSRYRWGWMGG